MERQAVVYFPNINTDKINVFREKYDPQYRIIRPHITLVFPISGISEEQVIEHLNIITTKSIKPFQIEFKGLIRSFDDYLFLLVEKGNEEIIRVHNLLYSGALASQPRNDIRFIPHITLGAFQTTDGQFNTTVYEQAFAEAEELNTGITCNFDDVSLIKGDGISPAKLVKSFVFTR